MKVKVARLYTEIIKGQVNSTKTFPFRDNGAYKITLAVDNDSANVSVEIKISGAAFTTVQFPIIIKSEDPFIKLSFEAELRIISTAGAEATIGILYYKLEDEEEKLS